MFAELEKRYKFVGWKTKTYDIDVEAVKKSFRHCPEALVYWEGEYLKPNDFCDKINLEVLDKFYSEMKTHFTYLEAKKILTKVENY